MWYSATGMQDKYIQNNYNSESTGNRMLNYLILCLRPPKMRYTGEKCPMILKSSPRHIPPQVRDGPHQPKSSVSPLKFRAERRGTVFWGTECLNNPCSRSHSSELSRGIKVAHLPSTFPPPYFFPTLLLITVLNSVWMLDCFYLFIFLCTFIFSLEWKFQKSPNYSCMIISELVKLNFADLMTSTALINVICPVLMIICDYKWFVQTLILKNFRVINSTMLQPGL